MNGPVGIILIVAAVCYIMVRRVIGEPAEGKRMLILPAILTVIGLSDVSSDAHNASAVAFLVATVAISVAIGALRGLSVRFSERDGVAHVHYTAATIVLWLANLAAQLGANTGLHAVSPHLAGSLGNTFLLTVGTGMLMEGLVTLGRALRTDAQVIWSQGQQGQPHATSPFLDNLQQHLSNPPTRRDR